MSPQPNVGGDGTSPPTGGSPRSVRSALQDAANEARRRRRLLRWALIGLGGALAVLGALLLGSPR
jgi:hypothetical protein